MNNYPENPKTAKDEDFEFFVALRLPEEEPQLYGFVTEDDQQAFVKDVQEIQKENPELEFIHSVGESLPNDLTELFPEK